MMEELRPNLVGMGNLLGVGGLLDDHHGHLMNNSDKSGQRKCNTSGSSAEDFSALYGGLPHGHDHHTPAHTPPSASRSITDHNGKFVLVLFILMSSEFPRGFIIIQTLFLVFT
ncbi:hypothetical protein HHI36_011041 [Cryptolaemus montrouzieri]|uniref:Uncharacterized protein n=1 Tax=Cryptolaemus montrouzieri TaxID=559131 RepID=A0ABD2MLE4_9CUCU